MQALRMKTPKSVKMTKVIEVKSAVGKGTEEDPVREVVQYWDLKGHLLAEYDSEKT